MILIEQEKGSHHSTMQKGSPKIKSAYKCCRNIYSESIREGIGMCLKVLQAEFIVESVPKLGIIQVFGGTINKYGYLYQSISGSALTIDYLTRIDAICSLFMNYS